MAERKLMPDDMGVNKAERVPTRAAAQGEPSPEETKHREGARLRRISVFKLRAHPLQPASRHSGENVRDLMESILKLGLQEPPLVRLLADGRFEILAGHRRARAWQLLALAGLVEERIPAFVYTGMSDREATYVIAAEYAHRKEFSAVHTARVIGEAWRELGLELGRDPSTRELAAVLPWAKSSVDEYIRIHQTLQDPTVGPLVQRLDSAPKSLLYQVLPADRFSTQRAAVEAYEEGGAAALRKVLRAAKGGRPKGVVTRRNRGKQGYDLTIRVRATMSADEVEQALEALGAVREELLVQSHGSSAGE